MSNGLRVAMETARKNAAAAARPDAKKAAGAAAAPTGKPWEFFLKNPRYFRNIKFDPADPFNPEKNSWFVAFEQFQEGGHSSKTMAFYWNKPPSDERRQPDGRCQATVIPPPFVPDSTHMYPVGNHSLAFPREKKPMVEDEWSKTKFTMSMDGWAYDPANMDEADPVKRDKEALAYMAWGKLKDLWVATVLVKDSDLKEPRFDSLSAAKAKDRGDCKTEADRIRVVMSESCPFSATGWIKKKKDNEWVKDGLKRVPNTEYSWFAKKAFKPRDDKVEAADAKAGNKAAPFASVGQPPHPLIAVAFNAGFRYQDLPYSRVVGRGMQYVPPEGRVTDGSSVLAVKIRPDVYIDSIQQKSFGQRATMLDVFYLCAAIRERPPRSGGGAATMLYGGEDPAAFGIEVAPEGQPLKPLKRQAIVPELEAEAAEDEEEKVDPDQLDSPRSRAQADADAESEAGASAGASGSGDGTQEPAEPAESSSSSSSSYAPGAAAAAAPVATPAPAAPITTQNRRRAALAAAAAAAAATPSKGPEKQAAPAVANGAAAAAAATAAANGAAAAAATAEKNKKRATNPVAAVAAAAPTPSKRTKKSPVAEPESEITMS